MESKYSKIATEDQRWLWLSSQIENPAYLKGSIPVGIIGAFSRDICAVKLKNHMDKTKLGTKRTPLVFEYPEEQSQETDSSLETLAGEKWIAKVSFVEAERYWMVAIYQK